MTENPAERRAYQLYFHYARNMVNSMQTGETLGMDGFMRVLFQLFARPRDHPLTSVA